MMFPYSTLSLVLGYTHMRQSTRHLGGFLQPLVSGSACLMLVCLRRTKTQFFFGKILPDMPYSALLGSTVDTCYCQSAPSWVLGSCDRLSSFSVARVLRVPLVPGSHLFSVCREEYRKIGLFSAMLVSTTAVVCSGLVMLTSRYVPFFCSQAQLRCILACLDEKDSYVVHPCRGAEAYSHGLLFRRP